MVCEPLNRVPPKRILADNCSGSDSDIVGDEVPKAKARRKRPRTEAEAEPLPALPEADDEIAGDAGLALIIKGGDFFSVFRALLSLLLCNACSHLSPSFESGVPVARELREDPFYRIGHFMVWP